MYDQDIASTGLPPKIGAPCYPHPKHPHITVEDFTIHDVPKLMHAEHMEDKLMLYKGAGKHGGSYNSWGSGDESYDDQVKGAERGWVTHLDEARKLFDQVERNVPIESMQREWDLGIAGAFPCVPEALQGNPLSMYCIDQTEGSAGAIRIWVNVASSAGIGVNELRKRGNAIMALCMVLATARPVEVWCYAPMKHGGYTGKAKEWLLRCKVSDSPMDIAQASYPLISTAFGRSFCYALAYQRMGFDSRRGLSWQSVTDDKLLLPGPADIVVPALRMGNTQIVTDPLGWVQDEVDKSIRKDKTGESMTLPAWAKEDQS